MERAVFGYEWMDGKHGLGKGWDGTGMEDGFYTDRLTDLTG